MARWAHLPRATYRVAAPVRQLGLTRMGICGSLEAQAPVLAEAVANLMIFGNSIPRPMGGCGWEAEARPISRAYTARWERLLREIFPGPAPTQSVGLTAKAIFGSWGARDTILLAMKATSTTFGSSAHLLANGPG